jgi:hypothetical protein
MYLVSIIDRKPINSIMKLNGAFDHSVEGILSSSIIVGIYRTAPGRHSRACRTFPVSVIISVTVVVSYEAGTRVTPLDITFIHSFSLEDRHKL